MPKINILELFAGSRSIGKVAESFGWNVFSVDLVEFDEIDLVADIEFLRHEQIPFIPDVIWASPPCTSYSIAAISHHRNGSQAKSEFAKKSDRVILNMLKLIAAFPQAIYYIENPVGMLRKMPFMKCIPRATVTYCQYGDNRQKPTDIWSNNIHSLFVPNGWQPKPKCKRGASCHVAAPRSCSTGTQSLKSAYEKSIIPEQLCRDILAASLTNVCTGAALPQGKRGVLSNLHNNQAGLRVENAAP